MEEWDRCDLVEPCPQNRQPPPYRLVEKTPDGRSYRVAMRKTWVTHLRLHGITVNPETTMNVLPAAPTKPNILTAERTERLALKGTSTPNLATDYSLTDDSLSSSFYGEDEAMNLPPPCLTTNHQQDRGNEKGLLLIQTGSEREGKRRSVGLR